MALAISRQAAPGPSPNRVQPSHLKREETMPEQPEPVQLNQAVERVAKRFQIPSQERHIAEFAPVRANQARSRSGDEAAWIGC
jgi:hypothetical protein